MGNKNKGGREARKPKADKKTKAVPTTSLIPPTRHASDKSGKSSTSTTTD